jgi:hypothetical protein
MFAEGLKNLVEVSKPMGHEDLETTMKYLHPDTQWICGCRQPTQSREVTPC